MCVLGLLSLIVSTMNAARGPFEDWPAFNTPASRIVNQYSYFTIWSAIIGTVVAGAYALDAGRNHQRFAPVLRIDAALMLTVTGLVFNILLAPDEPLHGSRLFTNTIQHQLLPLAMPLLWIASMPLRRSRDITWANTAKALIIPSIWVGYTLIRGELTGGYYPYFFLDVSNLGYLQSLINIAGVYALFGVLMVILLGVERLLTRKQNR